MIVPVKLSESARGRLGILSMVKLKKKSLSRGGVDTRSGNRKQELLFFFWPSDWRQSLILFKSIITSLFTVVFS